MKIYLLKDTYIKRRKVVSLPTKNHKSFKIFLSGEFM